MNTLAAITKRDAVYPGYVNLSREDDGSIKITVRGDASKHQGSFICGHASDKGKHERCTPGDDNCNNYCNMAPEKGKMQDHPKSCEQIRCGETVSVVLSVEEWQNLLNQM